MNYKKGTTMEPMRCDMIGAKLKRAEDPSNLLISLGLWVQGSGFRAA